MSGYCLRGVFAMSDIRRLFVTGASTGLGQGLADHYARAGAHLGLVARRESLLRELEKEWTGRGARVEVYAGDVADTDFMARSAQGVGAAHRGAEGHDVRDRRAARGRVHGGRDRIAQAHLHVSLADEAAQGGDGARAGVGDPQARAAAAHELVELRSTARFFQLSLELRG